MNELAQLAERVGVDIELGAPGHRQRPAHRHPLPLRRHRLRGSCFPKDVRALVHTAKDNRVALGVLEAVEAANTRQKKVLVDKVIARFGADLTGRKFAVWGLAFKPNTDDMREAPSCVVIRELAARGALLQAYDPVAMDMAARVLGDVPALRFVASQAAALVDADALLILTEWKEFKSPDFDLIRSALKQPVVFDGRNLYDPRFMRSLGIEYRGVGRGVA
jgi:UDPglucose 6-dehydrogenase